MGAGLKKHHIEEDVIHMRKVDASSIKYLKRITISAENLFW